MDLTAWIDLGLLQSFKSKVNQNLQKPRIHKVVQTEHSIAIFQQTNDGMRTYHHSLFD